MKGGSVRTGAGWRARTQAAGFSRSFQKLAPSLQHSSDMPSCMHQDPHGHEPPQALRMTHGLPDATERAFRRAEGVEGDLKAICLSGGEGP